MHPFNLNSLNTFKLTDTMSLVYNIITFFKFIVIFETLCIGNVTGTRTTFYFFMKNLTFSDKNKLFIRKVKTIG